jgi:hypothetical protein
VEPLQGAGLPRCGAQVRRSSSSNYFSACESAAAGVSVQQAAGSNTEQ